EARTACIADKQAAVASAKCWPGSEAYWAEDRNEVRCRCLSGLQWNANKTECLKPDQDFTTMLSEIASNNGEANNARLNEINMTQDQNNKAQYAENGPSSSQQSEGGPDLMGGLLNALSNAVSQANNTNNPATNQGSSWGNSSSNSGTRTVSRRSTQQSNPFCDSYAKTAVAQFQESQARNCGYSDRRWQGNYDNHYNWCTTASKTSADSETKARAKGLQECTPRSQDVYFAIISSAYKSSDRERRLPECRFQSVVNTTANYGKKSEVEQSASYIQSMGYTDVSTQYFDSKQALDRFLAEWQQRTIPLGKKCHDAINRADREGK
ncbi:MAG TPA: hypothetical protein VF790_09555, partial [Dissulfurispiraceae bacterium]